MDPLAAAGRRDRANRGAAGRPGRSPEAVDRHVETDDRPDGDRRAAAVHHVGVAVRQAASPASDEPPATSPSATSTSSRDSPVIVHLVLYRPKADLDADARERFVDALTAAHRDIPAIRRFTVGRRLEDGPAYDGIAAADFPYMALIEFDDAEGLRSYLCHPAHTKLGQAFRSTLDAALVHDYETAGAAAAGELLGR